MCKSEYKNPNKIALLNITSTVILQGLAFVSSPYFSRVLGPANYGIVSVYTTWVQVVSIVFGLRINGTLIMGMNEYPAKEQKKYQSSILVISLLSYSVFSLLTLLFINIYFKKNTFFVFMVLIHGFGMHCVNFANSKFSNEFKAGINLFLSVSLSVSTIILSILLMSAFSKANNYWGRILGESLPYVIAGFAITIIICFKGKHLVDFRYWRFCIPLAVPMVFHGLAGLLLNQSDRIMLQKMEADSIVGIYSLAYTFSNVLFVCWSALNNSWVPFFYDYMRKRQYDIIQKKMKNYIELFSVITIGFILLAPEVYHIFAVKEYWSGTGMIPIFAIGTFFVFLYSFSVNYEIFYKSTKVIAFGSVLSAACNILLNIVLIRLWGSYGAVVATVLSYLLQFIFQHISAMRISKERKDYFLKLPMYIGYFSVVIVFVGISVIKISVFVRWILSIMIGGYEFYKILRRKSIF